MVKALAKYTLILLLLLGGCASDFQSKRWARSELKGKPPIAIVKGLIELGFTENRGMVFGLLNHDGHALPKIVLTVMRIAILIAVSIFIALRRRRTILFLLPFLFILAGAWGNILDIASAGFVIDFIHIHLGSLLDWPFYFNLADAYLCIGMALLAIQTLAQRRERSISVTSTI